ncbi:MAG: family 20 glycosylhydrolase, partial [Acidobacteria bacterium]|nr:family 20 glycosylhydrolase [Candidatus Sulfomarinibacter sp. MAG AM2]
MSGAAILIILAIALGHPFAEEPSNLDTILPVRGFAISAPAPDRVDDFVDFINRELVPNNVNTLVLRVDFKYRFTSRPELRGEDALSKSDIRKIVKACRKGNIRLIPQINLLGHQSWQTKLGKLLEVYPEFDETPWIELPETYEWPNDDGLYCKSYCPLHPGVHDVVFALVDEIVKVFDADAFHAGMDEVFYIGMDSCPRCGGHDKAELFAGEVSRIRNHLARSEVELWIWGDRLIDGKSSGIGEWEASMNSTHRAIDLIPKDIVINDWH